MRRSLWQPRQRRRGEEGIALVVALLIVVLLTALVVSFNYEMQVEAAHTMSVLAELEAYTAARSAVALGMGLLTADFIDEEQLGIEAHDGPLDVWAQGIPYQAINNAVLQCRVSDEFGKIPLNYLIDESGALRQSLQAEMLLAALEELLRLRGAEGNPVEAIVDWLDYDDQLSGNGAESEHYLSLETPYAAKNGPLDSIEELLLVRDITPEVFFGDPEQEQLPLTELLTHFGHPGGKININTAAPEVLRAVFIATDGNPQLAEQVLVERENNPFRSESELVGRGYLPQPPPDNRAGEAPERPEAWVVESQVFRVQGYGLADELKVRAEAYVWRNPMPDGVNETLRILSWRVLR